MIDFERRRGARPWEVPLATYLGKLPVLTDAVTRYEMQILRSALAVAGLGRAAGDQIAGLGDTNPAFSFSVHSGPIVRSLIAHDAATGEILGGSVSGLPYVRPQHRGRGLGAEMVYVADMATVRILDPISYSVSGLAARVTAHRLHLDRAACRGDFIPPEAWEGYTRDASGLCLAQPWTIARHCEHVAHKQARKPQPVMDLSDLFEDEEFDVPRPAGIQTEHLEMTL